MIPFGQVASFLVAQVRKLNDSNGRRSQLCDGGLKTWLRRTHVDRDKAGDGLEAVSAPHIRRMEKLTEGGEKAPCRGRASGFSIIPANKLPGIIVCDRQGAPESHRRGGGAGAAPERLRPGGWGSWPGRGSPRSHIFGLKF